MVQTFSGGQTSTNNISRIPPEERLCCESADNLGKIVAAELGAEVCAVDYGPCVHVLQGGRAGATHLCWCFRD